MLGQLNSKVNETVAKCLKVEKRQLISLTNKVIYIFVIVLVKAKY